MDLDLEIRFPSEGGLVPLRSERQCTRRPAAEDGGPTLPATCSTPRFRSLGSGSASAEATRRPNQSNLLIRNASNT